MCAAADGSYDEAVFSIWGPRFQQFTYLIAACYSMFAIIDVFNPFRALDITRELFAGFTPERSVVGRRLAILQNVMPAFGIGMAVLISTRVFTPRTYTIFVKVCFLGANLAYGVPVHLAQLWYEGECDDAGDASTDVSDSFALKDVQHIVRRTAYHVGVQVCRGWHARPRRSRAIGDESWL